jgi:hypothetical protein
VRVSLCRLQVKAWCYYESRLLGAHHGLISTYALETLVLYVFNKHHQAIDSPLSVRRGRGVLAAQEQRREAGTAAGVEGSRRRAQSAAPARTC